MLSVRSTSEKFENATTQVILDLCLRKTWPEKSRGYCDVIIPSHQACTYQAIFKIERAWNARVNIRGRAKSGSKRLGVKRGEGTWGQQRLRKPVLTSLALHEAWAIYLPDEFQNESLTRLKRARGHSWKGEKWFKTVRVKGGIGIKKADKTGVKICVVENARSMCVEIGKLKRGRISS